MYYTIQEVAKELKVSVPTIRNWIKNGCLVAKKFKNSNIWRISDTEIERKKSEVK